MVPLRPRVKMDAGLAPAAVTRVQMSCLIRSTAVPVITLVRRITSAVAVTVILSVFARKAAFVMRQACVCPRAAALRAKVTKSVARKRAFRKMTKTTAGLAEMRARGIRRFAMRGHASATVIP